MGIAEIATLVGLGIRFLETCRKHKIKSVFVNDVEVDLDSLRKKLTDFDELQKRGISEAMILAAIARGKK